jgi:bifunctional DNA-binding transcriptional regulator/antitoxin component of YhaV-PrlF toxin-antitoxin module
VEVVKLGKKGQLSIPQGVLRQLGLTGESTLLLDVAEDGAIVLRQAGVYPIEIYSDARLAEFEKENRVPASLEKKVRARIARRK